MVSLESVSLESSIADHNIMRINELLPYVTLRPQRIGIRSKR